MTFGFDDGGTVDERVNNCCHDFLGVGLGCGSESTCRSAAQHLRSSLLINNAYKIIMLDKPVELNHCKYLLNSIVPRAKVFDVNRQPFFFFLFSFFGGGKL